jgi:hypothetical protein
MTAQSEHSRNVAAKLGLLEHEREVELRAQLGLKRGGFWAAKKNGGPVHFWVHEDELVDMSKSKSEARRWLGPVPLVGLLCSAPGGHVVARWHERNDVAPPTHPSRSKRVCVACRRIVVEEDL